MVTIETGNGEKKHPSVTWIFCPAFSYLFMQMFHTFIDCYNLVAIKYNANKISVSIFPRKDVSRIKFMKMSKERFADPVPHKFPKVLSAADNLEMSLEQSR